MDRSNTIREVTELLKQTGEAHHKAFEATDGADPDWAMWYAEHLTEHLRPLLETELSQAEVVCALMQAADEHQARAPDQPWPEYYSALVVERFRAEPQERLALYHYRFCPYCIRVRRVIDELGIEVELRDILESPEHRKALVDARARATVPVLRCTSPEKDRWMPESRDIIRYLRTRFG